MTLPAKGNAISLSQVDIEIGKSANTLITLNDDAVRQLAGIASGTIGMDSLQGKSAAAPGVYAYLFNSSTHGIRLPANNILNLTTKDFTVEFWMKANTTQTTYSTITDSSSNNTGLGIALGANRGSTPGNLSFWCQDTSTVLQAQSATLLNDFWHHVACVKSANTGYIFIDGIKTANTTTGEWSTVSGASFSDGCIGRSRFGSAGNSDNNYIGYLSNFRVSNAALYTANFTVPAKVYSPEANTTLLVMRANTVADISNNRFAISPQTVYPNVTANIVPPIISTFYVTVATSTNDLDVSTFSKSLGWDGSAPLVVTINSGVVVSSTSVGAYAMTFSGTYPGDATLINNGTIIGRGGNGGNGVTGGGGGSGTSAGPALNANFVKINVTNNGIIAGGGGGGGAGGGGGRASKGGSTYGTGGGGGGGIGASVGGYSPYYPGSPGTTTSNGAGGSGYTPLGYSVGAAGGNGGSYGSAGGGGGYGYGFWYSSGGGAGGAAGACTYGGANITWTVVGGRYGTLG